MEYFDHGDLGKFIYQGLTEQDAQVIGKQLLEGLAILHAQNWAHRDLKPQNIFVVSASPNWWVKIGDFGISKRLREGETGTSVGTPLYVAPEVQGYLPSQRRADVDSESESEEQTYKTSVAVDMWSLGCVLYQIPTKTLPFSSKELVRYCRKKRPFPEEELRARNVSQAGSDFIHKLLLAQPSERLTAKAALQERWITTADNHHNGIGVMRAQSKKTKPHLEPLIELGALQDSASSPPATETTVKAPVAPARLLSDGLSDRTRQLNLDKDPIPERHKQVSPRQTSALNRDTNQRSSSSSARDLPVLPSHQRNGGLVHGSDRSPPRTASIFDQEHDPKLGIVLWPFVKIEPHDLALKPFEYVHDIKKRDKDWWYGTNDAGERGFFPSNYIGQTRLQAEALFDFEKQDPADIDLKKGERITNITIFTRGWWIGTNSLGKRGGFPYNYVKLDQDAIKEELDLERRVSNGQSQYTVSPPGPNPRRESTSDTHTVKLANSRRRVGRVLKDFKTPDGSVKIERGELITTIQKLPSQAYLLGINSSNQQHVVIPRSVVDLC